MHEPDDGRIGIAADEDQCPRCTRIAHLPAPNASVHSQRTTGTVPGKSTEGYTTRYSCDHCGVPAQQNTRHPERFAKMASIRRLRPRMPKPTPSTWLHLTVMVEQPVEGVAYALQRGRDELDAVQVAFDGALWFHFQVEQRATPIGTFDLRGAHVQGPRGNRFVYINSGTSAGQADSCWSRRAKIPLTGLPASPDGARFLARFTGTAGDGGPACASVRLLDGGWIEDRSA